MAKPTKGEIRKLMKRMRDDILGLSDALKENKGRNAMLFVCDLQRVARATRDLIADRYPQENPVEEEEEDDEADEDDDEADEDDEVEEDFDDADEDDGEEDD